MRNVLAVAVGQRTRRTPKAKRNVEGRHAHSTHPTHRPHRRGRPPARRRPRRRPLTAHATLLYRAYRGADAWMLDHPENLERWRCRTQRLQAGLSY
eukprot:5321376-Prymnesium_polylepis.1